MTVLGLETATTVCAAAVARDGENLAEELVDERNVHAEKLMGMVDAVLRRSGLTLEMITGIAVSIGPGSFTGLRIGLSVAKGLAYAAGKPLAPVPTLEAMALKAMMAAGSGVAPEYVLPLLDARRGDVYCALYRVGEGTLLPAWAQRVMPLHAVVEALPARTLLVTGDARGAFEQLVREKFPDMIRRLHVATDDVARCSAAVVAQIGERLLRQGAAADPGLLEPEYLRDFHATTPH